MNHMLVTLHADGRLTKVVQAHRPSYAQLKKIVGGDMEQVPWFPWLSLKLGDKIKGYRGTCWCNKEGEGLPINEQATLLWQRQSKNLITWLRGDVLFLARTEEPEGGLHVDNAEQCVL